MFVISSNDRVVFPPFQLDMAAGRLSRGSKALHLRPKAFSVLKYLAERPGRLVSKEELLQMNWPNVHVGDDVLKGAIAEIRKVLEDPPKSSRFIGTEHRRGYRFVAGAEASPNVAPSQISFPETAQTMNPNGSRRFVFPPW
jgi:DNA-binding winged helix-turn-helix (wHTH) protein